MFNITKLINIFLSHFYTTMYGISNRLLHNHFNVLSFQPTEAGRNIKTYLLKTISRRRSINYNFSIFEIKNDPIPKFFVINVDIESGINARSLFLNSPAGIGSTSVLLPLV